MWDKCVNHCALTLVKLTKINSELSFFHQASTIYPNGKKLFAKYKKLRGFDQCDQIKIAKCL